MRRVLQVVGVGVGLVVLGCAGLIGFGYTLPAEASLGVVEPVNAPPATVQPYLSTHQGLTRWWNGMAQAEGWPAMAIDHVAGPKDAPGMVVTFAMDGSVAETWTLVEKGPNRVVWDVDFAGMMLTHRTLELSGDGAGTSLAWSETATIDNPLMRLSGLLMDPEANFSHAIAGLDAVIAAK